MAAALLMRAACCLALAGCLAPPDYTGSRFRCDIKPLCPEGFACMDGVCQDFALAIGTLTVDSHVRALITIDGAVVGETPLFDVTVAAGNHRLVATDPSGREHQHTIVVEEGEDSWLHIAWSRP
ncbi:MAG TPA: PEGA domain-containing protein [Kofleriaceae bacterium]